jgi:hypothetical protein
LTFSSDHSYRTKQSASRIEKILPIKGDKEVLCSVESNVLFIGQAKENQKPIEQVRFSLCRMNLERRS